MAKKKRYVIGFLFDTRKELVTLIKRESKPGQEWQAGMLNGVGTTVENQESPLKAMQRAFREKAGVYAYSWDHYLTVHFDHCDLFVFCYSMDKDIMGYALDSIEERPIYILPVTPLPGTVEKRVPDLHWMLPMAIHHPTGVITEITYKKVKP